MSFRSLSEWLVCVRSVSLRQGLNFLLDPEKERRNIYRKGRMKEDKERINISEEEWQIEHSGAREWQTEGTEGEKEKVSAQKRQTEREREVGEQDSGMKRQKSAGTGMLRRPNPSPLFTHTLNLQPRTHTDTHGANLLRPLHLCACTQKVHKSSWTPPSLPQHTHTLIRIHTNTT